MITLCERLAGQDANVTTVPVSILRSTRQLTRFFQWTNDVADRLAFSEVKTCFWTSIMYLLIHCLSVNMAIWHYLAIPYPAGIKCMGTCIRFVLSCISYTPLSWSSFLNEISNPLKSFSWLKGLRNSTNLENNHLFTYLWKKKIDYWKELTENLSAGITSWFSVYVGFVFWISKHWSNFLTWHWLMCCVCVRIWVEFRLCLDI